MYVDINKTILIQIIFTSGSSRPNALLILPCYAYTYTNCILYSQLQETNNTNLQMRKEKQIHRIET